MATTDDKPLPRDVWNIVEEYGWFLDMLAWFDGEKSIQVDKNDFQVLTKKGSVTEYEVICCKNGSALLKEHIRGHHDIWITDYYLNTTILRFDKYTNPSEVLYCPDEFSVAYRYTINIGFDFSEQELMRIEEQGLSSAQFEKIQTMYRIVGYATEETKIMFAPLFAGWMSRFKHGYCGLIRDSESRTALAKCIQKELDKLGWTDVVFAHTPNELNYHLM